MQFLRAEGRVLSRSAVRLHGYGILNSILLGKRGFMSDDHPNAMEAETAVSALELVTAGLWERRPAATPW